MTQDLFSSTKKTQEYCFPSTRDKNQRKFLINFSQEISIPLTIIY